MARCMMYITTLALNAGPNMNAGPTTCPALTAITGLTDPDPGLARIGLTALDRDLGRTAGDRGRSRPSRSRTGTACSA